MASFFDNFREAMGLGRADHTTHMSDVSDEKKQEWEDRNIGNTYGIPMKNILPADDKFWADLLGPRNGVGNANERLYGMRFSYNTNGDNEDQGYDQMHGIIKFAPYGDKKYIAGIELSDGTNLGPQESIDFLRASYPRFRTGSKMLKSLLNLDDKNGKKGEKIIDDGITPNKFFKELRGYIKDVDEATNEIDSYYHYDPETKSWH